MIMGKWADPCGTAIQGQLVIEPEQAPDIPSPVKNKFNIEEGTWPSYQILHNALIGDQKWNLKKLKKDKS